jgi:hypothetical protein
VGERDFENLVHKYALPTSVAKVFNLPKWRAVLFVNGNEEGKDMSLRIFRGTVMTFQVI